MPAKSLQPLCFLPSLQNRLPGGGSLGHCFAIPCRPTGACCAVTLGRRFCYAGSTCKGWMYLAKINRVVQRVGPPPEARRRRGSSFIEKHQSPGLTSPDSPTLTLKFSVFKVLQNVLARTPTPPPAPRLPPRPLIQPPSSPPARRYGRSSHHSKAYGSACRPDTPSPTRPRRQ